MANPYINPTGVNKNLFLFQDLQNPRLTWRVYSQSGGSLVGPIFTGFYVNNSQFSISHEYSDGLGNDLRTAIESRMRTAIKSLSQRSRDVYSHVDTLDMIKNKAGDLVLGNLSDLIRVFGGDENNIAARAQEYVHNFSIEDELNKQLRRSAVMTQGSMSKLYDKTEIGIPDISNLNCVIWSTPDSNCREEIKNIYGSYFLGKFNFVANDGGGYWTAPNNIKLPEDNPLKDDMVTGAFTLRAGPYIFKNLLLKRIGWEFSKEFLSYPTSDGSTPESTNIPAYARVSIDLNRYKYITSSYLETTYAPVDSQTTTIPEKEIMSSIYNQNQ